MNCKTCKHKNDRCFCPPDKTCTAYEKELHKVKHTFEFETYEDWVPETSGCWTECPFSFLIDLGDYCKCLDGLITCPFLFHKN